MFNKYFHFQQSKNTMYGKLQASILLNIKIYVFNSQLENPNYPLLFQN